MVLITFPPGPWLSEQSLGIYLVCPCVPATTASLLPMAHSFIWALLSVLRKSLEGFSPPSWLHVFLLLLKVCLYSSGTFLERPFLTCLFSHIFPLAPSSALPDLYSSWSFPDFESCIYSFNFCLYLEYKLCGGRIFIYFCHC